MEQPLAEGHTNNNALNNKVHHGFHRFEMIQRSMPESYNDGPSQKFVKQEGDKNLMYKAHFDEFNSLSKLKIHTTFEDDGNCCCPGDQWMRIKGTNQNGEQVLFLQTFLRAKPECCAHCKCCPKCHCSCNCEHNGYLHFELNERSFFGFLYGESIEVKVKYFGLILLYVGTTLQAVSQSSWTFATAECIAPCSCLPRPVSSTLAHHSDDKYTRQLVFAHGNCWDNLSCWMSCCPTKQDVLVQKAVSFRTGVQQPNGHREDSCCSYVWDHYDVDLSEFNADEKFLTIVDIINQIIMRSRYLLTITDFNSEIFDMLFV